MRFSNLSLNGSPVLDAIRSRAQPLKYDPTDETAIAFCRHLTRNGWKYPDDGSKISQAEAAEVLDYTLAACEAANARPEIRLYCDKALLDYRQWKNGETYNH